MSVKRYDLDGNADGYFDDPFMKLRDDGKFIIHADYATLLARVARLEEALPDPDKLEILARWFDMKYPSDANPEVQTDLREWAKKIRRALEEK